MATPDCQLLAIVLDQFAPALAAVETLKEVKPGRESRGLARSLASEATLYDQFIRRAVLLSGAPSIRSQELHQAITEKFGAARTALLLTKLKELQRRLTDLTTDFISTTRNEQTMLELGRIGSSARANATKTKSQRRLEKFSKVNADLITLLDEPWMPLAFSDVPDSMPGLRAFFHDDRDGPAQAIQAISEAFGCSCRTPHVAGLRCVCPICNSVFGELEPKADHWEFEIALRPEPAAGKSTARANRPAENSHDASASEQSVSWTSRLSLEGGHQAPTLKVGLCSLLQAIDGHTINPPRHHRLATLERSSMVFATLDDVVRSHDPPLDRGKRVALAFRLSSAVLQSACTPWADEAWRPKDWIVALDVGKRDRFPVVFLNRRIHPGQDIAKSEQANGESWGVSSREPILTRLGIALIQLFLGRTLADLRKDDPALLDEEQAKSHDSDLLDLITARKILSLRRLAQTISPTFENVVAACVTQQYRDRDANIRELDTRHATFLERATAAILIPLYHEVRRCLGYHQSKGAANRPPRAETKRDQSNPAQKPVEPRKRKPPSIPRRPVKEPAGDALHPPRPSSPPHQVIVGNPEGAANSSFANASNAEPAIVPPDASSDTDQRTSTPKPVETSSSEVKSQSGSGLLTPSGDSTNDNDASHDADKEEVDPLNPYSAAASVDEESSSSWSYGDYTESVDSAFAWLPIYTPKLPDDHPFLAFSETALLAIFASLCMTMATGGTNTGRPSTSGIGSQAGSSAARKRLKRRGGDSSDFRRDGGDEDDESPQGSPSASRIGPVEEEPVNLFACPYFKKDPVAHQVCYKYRLKRIRDVKQHIGRKHSLPIYCPRCIATFPREEDRDSHIILNQCSPRQLPKPEGTTEVQKRLLARRPPQGQPEPDQWYGIFYILFDSTVARPPSPYSNIDRVLLQGAVRYQEFVEGPGIEILRDVLTRSGAVTWNFPLGESDLVSFQQNILERGLRTLFEQWEGQSDRNTSSPEYRRTAVEPMQGLSDFVPQTPISLQPTPALVNAQIGGFAEQQAPVPPPGAMFSLPLRDAGPSPYDFSLPTQNSFGLMDAGIREPAELAIRENVHNFLYLNAQEVQNGKLMDMDPDVENFSWYSLSEHGQSGPF